MLNAGAHSNRQRTDASGQAPENAAVRLNSSLQDQPMPGYPLRVVTSGSSPAVSASPPAPLGAALDTTRSEPERRHSTPTYSPNSSTSTSAMSSMMKDQRTTPTQRISRAKKGKRVHACTHPGCEKVFTRAEHLRRHQLNHSTEVYYKCDICDKTFVRQDLLSRHTERHAQQARKAVATLAMAQRHRQFSSQFGINGIAVLPAPPPPPTSDYGGSTHVFDATSHPAPRIQNPESSVVPQIMPAHSPHQSPTASIVSQHSASSIGSFNPGFPSPIPMAQSAPDSPLDFTSADSTPPPSTNLRGQSHLPFHLQQKESQRQPEPYLIPVTSHPEVMRRPLVSAVNTQRRPQGPAARTESAWGNYEWLFDESVPGPSSTELAPTLAFLHPEEAQYYQEAGLNYDPSNNVGGKQPAFFDVDDTTRQQVLILLGNSVDVYSDSVSTNAMHRYLRLYWTKFHPTMPLLHRPTFYPTPDTQMAMLVAIVLAIGASYAGSEANNFAMAVYDKVRGYILNSDELSSHGAGNLQAQQLILLTDIFGKLRSRIAQTDGTQLDLLLLNNLRQGQSFNVDPLANIRRYNREGLEINYEAEWHSWIGLESRKRVALMLFMWDATQISLFGRDMHQTVFDLRIQLPCEEFLWDANSANDWINNVDAQQEYPGYLDTLKRFFGAQGQLPGLALSPLSSYLVLLGIISVGLDLQRRDTSVSTNPNDTSAKQKVLRSLELWRVQFETVLAQILVQPWYQRFLLTYHMAFILLHSNLQSLFATAGDTRAVKNNQTNMYRARQEMEQWVNLQSAQVATWHAVRILLRYLCQPQLYDEELYVSWCTYIATLVCWAYGELSPAYDSRGMPIPSDIQDDAIYDPQSEMNMYLQQLSTQTWQQLAHESSRRKRTRGLLTVVGGTMESTKWMMMKEALEVLKRLKPSTRAAKGV